MGSGKDTQPVKQQTIRVRNPLFTESGKDRQPVKHLDYMTRAIRITGIGIQRKETEMIYRICRLVQKKGGNTNLLDVSKIQADVERKYEEPEQTETHDQSPAEAGGTNNQTNKTMEEEYLHDLQGLIDEAKKEAYAFYGKGNKSAGTRLRKKMMEVKQAAQDIRVDVQERKNQ